MDAMHPYESLPLFGTGMFLALAMMVICGLMLAKPVLVMAFLKRFPRNHNLGQILLGLGLAWFWLLIAPPGFGLVSKLAMDLGEFNGVKPLLRIVVPVGIVAVSISVKEFLAVRALGLLGLMVAAPLLGSAFLKDPVTRLLVPVAAYVLIVKSLFWVGMPYLFRDFVTWLSATPRRFKAWAAGGLAYGVLVAVCAVMFWRGH